MGPRGNFFLYLIKLPVLLPLLLLLLLLLPPLLCREPLEPDVVELLVAVDAGDRLQIPEHLCVENEIKQNKKIVFFNLQTNNYLCQSANPRPLLAPSCQCPRPEI